jgi:hypothetical protein
MTVPCKRERNIYFTFYSGKYSSAEKEWLCYKLLEIGKLWQAIAETCSVKVIVKETAKDEN